MLVGAGATECYLDIAGDLDADVIILDDIWRETGTTSSPLRTVRVGGVFPPNRTFKIGGRLRGPDGSGFTGGMQFAQGGLQGQVIINADSAGFQWLGDVVAGASLLSHPSGSDGSYTQPSSVLGGGAVGLVPFDLHDEDCAPANGGIASPVEFLVTKFCHLRGNPSGSFVFSQATDETLRLRFYGPVLANNGTPTIEMQDPANPNNWLPIPANKMTVSVAPTGFEREVVIHGRSVGFPAAHWGVTVPSGLYRVTRGGLKCDDVLNTPSVKDFAPYYFKLIADCNFDGDADEIACQPGAQGCVADCDDGSATGTPDGGVTIDDLVYYLDLIATGDPAADVDDGSSTGTPDGGVTIDDLLYYLVRFNAGC